jgi:predicted RNase H-like HicB family nuclease
MVSVNNIDRGAKNDTEFRVELHRSVPNERNTLLTTVAQIVQVYDSKNEFFCELNTPGLLSSCTKSEVFMLIYKSAYKWEDGVCLGEVLDFPGTVACGSTLTEAQTMLAAALRDMAETNLLRGEPLPLPDDRVSDIDADLEEPIYLLLQAGQQLAMQVTAPAP